uniref:Uncharacterized protein n=1 Tax=Caenorhabditis japonica TaxID=281687 RepID=A0A8R1I642_CAEJA
MILFCVKYSLDRRLFRPTAANQLSTVGALGAHSFCHTFNLTQLVGGGRPEESSINVCACRGPLCNGSTINSSTPKSGSLATKLILIATLFVIFDIMPLF